MFKKIIIVIISSLILSGCTVGSNKSGVEIMSYPTAKVYIDGKEAGMTPYKNNNLKPGEMEIKLETAGANWSKTIELQNGVSTVIDWEFAKPEEKSNNENKEASGGYILYLEKTGDSQKSGLMINSIPNKSAISIDGEIKGFSPLKINDFGQGDKQITISFPGYKTINIFGKALSGYQLVIDGSLIKETIKAPNIPEPEVTPINQIELGKKMIKIKETETGWLRVREASSSASKEVDKINPGEKFELLNEMADWYQINLGEGKNGWISSKYAEKLE